MSPSGGVKRATSRTRSPTTRSADLISRRMTRKLALGSAAVRRWWRFVLECDTMIDVVGQKLSRVLADQGREVWRDAPRLEGLLRDYCGQEHRREVRILLGALSER